MTSRLAGCCASALAAVVAGTVAAQARGSVAPTAPLPSPGNVSVTRLVLDATAARAGRTPRLALASGSRVPPGVFVVASVQPLRQRSRFAATVAAFDTTAASPGRREARAIALKLPPGVRLIGSAQTARDVLYGNPTPAFALTRPAGGTLLAGDAPPKLAPGRIVYDAQLLAFDRAAPLAEMELLGLPYVALELPTTWTTAFPVTVGFSHLDQVNAVELRFPADVSVVKAVGPQATTTMTSGPSVQLVASSGLFKEGVPYALSLELSRAPRRGESIVVRASTHYFESSLPFSERFVLP